MGVCGSSTVVQMSFTSDEDWILAGSEIPPDNKYPQSFTGYEMKEKQALPCIDNSDKAECDVFFVYHKSLYGLSGNEKENVQNEIEIHASIFNNCSAIYCPNYRYAKSENDISGIEVAYNDVRTAFLHFIKTWSSKRPLILAGEGQGSYYLTKLIKEIFLDNEKLKERAQDLRNRLVAAYLPGSPIIDSDISSSSLMKCSNIGRDTGTVISWCTSYDGSNGSPSIFWYPGKERNWGEESEEKETTYVCVNPISWDNDTSGSVKENQGSMSEEGVLEPRICGAKFGKGYQIITVESNNNEYSCFQTDFMPFWMNIRTNAAARLGIWKNKQLM